MMCDWAHEAQMPLHILLTKADKLKKGPANNTKLAVKKALKHMGDSVSVQIYSSLKKEGTDVLRATLSNWLNQAPDAE